MTWSYTYTNDQRICSICGDPIVFGETYWEEASRVECIRCHNEKTSGVPFGNLSALQYIQQHYSQDMSDNGYEFSMASGMGHIEFYQYGPTHIAIVVRYSSTHERAGLLVINPLEGINKIDLRVRFFLQMLRSVDSPPARRIRA